MRKKSDIEKELGFEVYSMNDVAVLFSIGAYSAATYLKRNNIQSVSRGYYKKSVIDKHAELLKAKRMEKYKHVSID